MASKASAAGDTRQQGGRTNVDLEQELAEAHRREAATAQVLKAISRSTFNLQDVLDSLIKSAAELTDAETGLISRPDGEVYRVAAIYNPYSPEVTEILKHSPIPSGRQSASGRAVLERRVVHIHDVFDDPEYTFVGIRNAEVRTILAVPMLRENIVLGVILCARGQVRPFTAKQIELVHTFADQAAIAIENTRLFESEQASKRELQESLEYQTATSEVLNVISRSPTELQPVLDAIAATAARLCESLDATVWRVAGERVRVVAQFGSPPSASHPLTRGSVTGRAIVDRKTIHVHDLAARVETEYPDVKEIQQRIGHLTMLATPLLSQGEALGAISVRKNHVHPFSDRQIALLQTFADQAVIAIENARLFEEVQARTRELTEALEQQTATADVLKVISRSALDVQKVLDALVESAARLCNAYDAAIVQVFGDGLRLVAHHGQIPMTAPVGQLTVPLVRGNVGGRAVIDRQTIHVADMLAEADEFPESRKRALQVGYRTALAVPLVHAGEAIGVIFIRRAEVRPFTERQIELVNTFADQAVIAIENSRLFEAEQASKRELQEALEQQTATSEVLSVIASSPGKLEPVFQAMLENATRLCEAHCANLYLSDGDALRVVAMRGASPEWAEFRRREPIIRFGPHTAVGRAVITKQVVHIPDITTDQAFEEGDPQRMATAKLGGARTVLAVPLLKESELMGAVSIYRQEVHPFSDKQINLVASFANQAVIAIENTRLFDEVQARTREVTESLEYQTATSDVLSVISRSKFDLQPVLDTIARVASQLCVAEDVVIHLREQSDLRIAAHYGSIPVELNLKRPIGRGWVAGRTVVDRNPIHVPDMASLADEFPLGHQLAQRRRYGATLGVPLLRENEAIGCLLLRRMSTLPFAEKQIALLQTFADQAVIAIENARLFEEVQARTRELAQTVEDLEIASQHKSQFVANMSHELRTPLSAILGYAELMQEGFYEPQGPKSLAALTRIRSNGKHLLGLINTVLDIAKIESGQFSLNLAEYSLEIVVETVRAATEALADSKKLALKAEIAERLPIGVGDEQRLTQVLLNLVGNAIKFTDAGEVCITATASNGHFALSVTDTGPGIPQEHQARIFEQFHQVDSSNTKAKGGTGLGLAIAKQIVEMHGGRIWVESTLGKGATFQMELPTRAEHRKSAP